MNKKIIILFCGVSILASSTTHAMERFKSWFSKPKSTSTKAPFNTAALTEFVGRYKLPYTTSEEQETTKAFFILIQEMKATHFTLSEQTLRVLQSEAQEACAVARQKQENFKTAALKALTISLDHHQYIEAFLASLSAAIPSIPMRYSSNCMAGCYVIKTILHCLTEISQDRLSIAIKAVPIAQAINTAWPKEEVHHRFTLFGRAMYQSFLPQHPHYMERRMELRNEDLDTLLTELENLQRRLVWIGVVMRATHGKLPLNTRSSLPAITDEERGADGVEESKGDE